MRSNKGITMMALVITVIILIILASITVSMIIGNQGLFDKTKDATNEVGIMQIDEEINAMWAKLAIGRSFSSLSLDERAEAFENELKKYDSTATVEVTNYSKKEFTINYKGLEKIFIAQRNAIASTVAEEPEEGGNTNPNTDPNQHPDTVTITFVTNGAPEIASQTIAYGGCAVKPTNPRKIDYDCVDWYEEQELSTVFDFSKPVFRNITLYARWYPLVDYYTYSVSNGVATITGFSALGLERYNSGKFTELQFPSSYNGTTITGIANNAFDGKNKLTSITFIDTMETIGSDSFKNCSNVANIEFGSGLKTIGYEAFLNCTSLTQLDIPQNVNLIKRYAFEGCTGLTRVEVTTDTTLYGTAFYGCSNIEYVKVKVGSTTEMRNMSIETDTFTSDRLIRSMETHHIKGGPWYYAKQGVVVELEDGITKIGNGVFCDAVKIGKVIIPPSVTEIGDRVFGGMTQMTKLSRTETGTNIITIPDTITSIGINTFRDSSNLENYEIPKAFIDSKKINKGTFYNTKISTLENIPADIETIEDYAFYSCKNLEETAMPNTIKTIGKYCFAESTNLEHLTLSNQLEAIAEDAFLNCTSLTGLVIPNSVQTIEYEAFTNCRGLTQLDIPSNVQTIKRYAFAGCTGLTRVEITTDTTHYGTAFYNCPNIEYVKIKVGTTTVMKDVSTYSDDFTSDRLIRSYETHHIKGGPWYYAKQGVIVEIEDGITRIGSGTFCDGVKIGKVIIPSSVTEIGNEVFGGMTQMTKLSRTETGINIITVPDTITSIGNNTFRNSSNLEDYEVPKALIDSKKINIRNIL